MCRLVQRGRRVTVYDSQPQRAAQFCAAVPGAQAAESLAGLAEKSDVVITILPDSRIVQTVLVGDGQSVLPSLRSGSIVLEMTSGDPAVTQDLARQCAARGVRMIDAPVSGGVARAVTGELAVMVGAKPLIWRPFTELMVKDLKTAMGLAEATHTNAPIAGACLERWRSALATVESGADHTEITKAVQSWNTSTKKSSQH